MDNLAHTPPASPSRPTLRAPTPAMLAQTFASLPPLSSGTDRHESQHADLSDVHIASRTIGQKSKTAPRGSLSPLQRWNSERRPSIQGNAGPGLPASLPASNAATASPGHLSITITPPQASSGNQTEDESGTVSGPAPQASGDSNAPQDICAEETDSDSESLVEDGSESDDEYGNLRHPRMAPATRAALEELIFAGKDHTTLHCKRRWEAVRAEEDQYVKDHRAWKYTHDFAAGAVNQFSSFGLGAIAANTSGIPWLFPVVSAVLSDLLGDRLAQLIRRSTIIPTASREHFENHRRIARAFGDLIADCRGKQAKNRFWVETTDAQGNKTKVKMTAAAALAHTGWQHGLGAFAQNLMVRGLPFMWFAYIYWLRDWYINDNCKPVFFPNASEARHDFSGITNSTAIGFCPDPQQVNGTAMRWALQIFGGMMAGGTTMLTNQLVSSLFRDRDERTTYSTRTWKLQADYLASARTDTKEFLDGISSGRFDEELGRDGMLKERKQDLVKSVHVLDRLQAKELSLAEKKSSLWTTYRGELDQITQKHREETEITPEFAGRRLDTALSMFGKMLSLLVYAGMLSHYSSRQDADHDDKLAQIVMLPLYLIVLGGYMWRDDFRLVGHVPYGIIKGCFRACREDHETEPESSDVVVGNPAYEGHDDDNPAESDRSVGNDSAQDDDRNDDEDSEAAGSSWKSDTNVQSSSPTRLTIGGIPRQGRKHADSDDDSE